MDYDDENPGYRSPVSVGPVPAASARDEREYSTLLEIQKDLHAELKAIDSVHVFDLQEKSLTIKQQIAAYKRVQRILEPIVARVDAAIDNVKIMQEERSNDG